MRHISDAQKRRALSPGARAGESSSELQTTLLLALECASFTSKRFPSWRTDLESGGNSRHSAPRAPKSDSAASTYSGEFQRTAGVVGIEFVGTTALHHEWDSNLTADSRNLILSWFNDHS